MKDGSVYAHKEALQFAIAGDHEMNKTSARSQREVGALECVLDIAPQEITLACLCADTSW